MALALDGMDAPLSPLALSAALGAAHADRNELWGWITAPCASGRLRKGDAVQIVNGDRRASNGLVLPIVEAAGVATVTDPRDPREAIAFVRAIWRDGRPWALDAQPWRRMLASGSLRRWRVAERVRTWSTPVVSAFEQLARQPSLDVAEASESRFYDRPDVVADYDRITGDGLSVAEAAIAAQLPGEGARVLVVGCGTGRESIALARHGHHVVGIDISAAAIAKARRRASEASSDATGFGSASFENVALGLLDERARRGARFDRVLLSSDVLCGIPGRANRIAALTRAREALKSDGSVVMAVRCGRGPARILLEAPRAVLAALGLGHREAGDRFGWQGPPPTRRFFHVYGDDVELATELDAAGLAYDGRLAGFVVARRSDKRAPKARATRLASMIETARVLRVLPRVERARLTSGPQPLAATMRGLGERAPRRDALGRARLRAAIARCDQLVSLAPRAPLGSSGTGCYRRALLEMALDAGAAEQPLVLGLRRHGLGHAWIGTTDAEEGFDWVVRV